MHWDNILKKPEYYQVFHAVEPWFHYVEKLLIR